MRVVRVGDRLVRFGDKTPDDVFWAAERAAHGQKDEATAMAVARAFRAVDVVELPRAVQRRKRPGVEWNVWACRWADQPSIERRWFDARIDDATLGALASVFEKVEQAPYEASLALELAGVLKP